MPPTQFQQKVYAALRKVPKGKVITYKQLAQSIGCKSAQAVGQALKNNPFAPEVPCHRVITSDFTIGGFMGKKQGAEIKRKIELLKKEGVEFDDGKLLDASNVVKPRR